MKATEPGRVVDMALGGFNGEKGQVMVQVQNTWWQPPLSGAATQKRLSQIDHLKVQNDLLKAELCARDGSYSWC